jgi:hypothetical protein
VRRKLRICPWGEEGRKKSTKDNFGKSEEKKRRKRPNCP